MIAKKIVLTVSLLSFFVTNASGNEAYLGDQSYIPWPKTVLQFKMTSKTIKASDWCSDDLGKKRTIGVTINLAKDIEGGVIDISDVESLTFKPKGLFTKGSNVSASLSSDGKRLYFDGNIEEDGGVTTYEGQYLQVNDEDEVVGYVDWVWVGSTGPYDKCSGTELVTGDINI